MEALAGTLFTGRQTPCGQGLVETAPNLPRLSRPIRIRLPSAWQESGRPA